MHFKTGACLDCYLSWWAIGLKILVTHEVCQLILQLKEIVELVCAPAITAGQVAYLKVIIKDYIYYRKRLFPGHLLKPKHHYLCHYPELIIHFGPLIHLWTPRFKGQTHIFQALCQKITLSQLQTSLQNFGRETPNSAGLFECRQLFPPSL